MGTRQEELDRIEREKLIISNQNGIKGRLDNVERELQITRKGHEAASWGEEVEDMEDVDLDEMEPREDD